MSYTLWGLAVESWKKKEFLDKTIFQVFCGRFRKAYTQVIPENFENCVSAGQMIFIFDSWPVECPLFPNIFFYSFTLRYGF